MSSRRRPPPDLPTLRRSRSSLTGAITKAKDKLHNMKELDVADYNVKSIERIPASVSHTEKGFLQTMEEAREFITIEETADTLQTEEDEALENFTESIADVRDLGAELLSLKRIKKQLHNIHRDLKAVRDAFTSNPEADQDAALKALEDNYTCISKEWDEADHDAHHPLKTNLDDCRLLITQLTSEMAGPKDRSVPSLHDLSSSFCCKGEREEESKLPTIDVPTFNGDIMAWSTFWAAFQSTVGNRDKLSDTTKLTYIRKAIKDPDTQTLLHSPQETPNMYQEVVKSLHARFDRTKEIHRNLVQHLLQLTNVKYNRLDLRRLVDTVNSTIASIKRTGYYVIVFSDFLDISHSTYQAADPLGAAYQEAERSLSCGRSAHLPRRPCRDTPIKSTNLW